MNDPSLRPNVLLLIDDQHRWDALGSLSPSAGSWLSSIGVRTPSLDALASRSVTFTQAVCNVPVCVPSRHSLLTGLRGYQLGVLTNGHYYPDQLPVPSLGTILAAEGYETASFGKMHWKPAAAPAAHVTDRRGFRVRATNDGERTDGPSDYHFEDFASPEELALRIEWEERFGRGGENWLGYLGGVAPMSSERFPEAWLAGLAVDFLRDRMRSPHEAPFCLMVSLDRPHPESIIPKDYDGLYTPGDIRLPPEFPPASIEPDLYLNDLRVAKEWRRLTDEEARVAIARYLTNITFVDECFGRVLRELESCGFGDNTLVIMTSDHGELLGERGACYSKYSLYESAIRVPLIMQWPQHPALAAGTHCDALVELIDVLPTIHEVVRSPIPRYLPGRTLSDYLPGSLRSAAQRRCTITEHYTPCGAAAASRTQWALRGQRYKLIERLGADGALYDLEEDPNEFYNRLDDPTLSSVRNDLRAQALAEVMRCAELYPAEASPLVRRAF